MKKHRIAYLDCLRILAIMAVIMIHSSAGFINDYSSASTEFLVANIFDSISRFGVPIFFDDFWCIGVGRT